MGEGADIIGDAEDMTFVKAASEREEREERQMSVDREGDGEKEEVRGEGDEGEEVDREGGEDVGTIEGATSVTVSS